MLEGTRDCDFEGLEPEIEYPCTWTYKVVGRDEAELRKAIDSALAEALSGAVDGREPTLTLSHTSRTGKYVSLKLELTVRDDGERRGLGQALHEHAKVVFVL